MDARLATPANGHDVRTPHVDALAASGMRFDRFYANSRVCSPTRAGFLTGRDADLVGAPASSAPILPGKPAAVAERRC